MDRADIQVGSFKDFTLARQRILLFKPEDLSPYLIYSILKDWFGKCSTEGIDETKMQWSYYILTSHLLFHIYDWKLHEVGIGVYPRDNEDNNIQREEEANEFMELLRNQIPKYTSKVKSAAARAFGFNFQNPFALYSVSADSFLGAINKGQDDISLNLERAMYQAAFFLYVASLEGLLNLIYEIYLDPSLRDERIYNRLRREQVDVKLRLAPVYCKCFKVRTIEAQTEEFQRFQYIVDLRNDFIHANITRPMRSVMITEDGIAFVIKEEPTGKYGLPRNPIELNLTHLNFVRQTIHNIVGVILNAMAPRYRRELEKVIESELVPVDIDEDEFVII